ncbi:MAG: HAMP domain-containing sensor histidine kinase [Clostridia bacterium]|nr:HAMP domain-containing sensor histidine kinase [Clostridia bacterium]
MKHRLTLRRKMTLWFTLSVVAITLLFFGASVFITRARLTELLKDDLSLALEQLSSQVEHKNGQLYFEDETPVKSGIMYYITEENGSELASHGEDITAFDAYPVQAGTFTHAQYAGETWLLLDSSSIPVGNECIRIRVAASCRQIQQTLRIFQLIFLLGVPIMTALAALIGSLLAKQSLKPVQQIICCADEITAGDLSRRIPEASGKDELGALANTLNHMLASLEESFRRERRFTSDASHELRTPVAVITVYAESLLTDTSLSQEEYSKVETILNECKRMQRMVSQMLTLTRGQEGRYPVLMEKVCLNDVLDGVHAVLEPVAEEQSITLHFTAESSIDLCADQSLLTQLVLNLTENAIKYGKVGGDAWVNAAQTDDAVLLTVRDNGIGISAENLPHIFERFFRADTARDRSGTGLGLSIVQWITSLHGGTIQAESHLHQGTIFTVTLPKHESSSVNAK